MHDPPWDVQLRQRELFDHLCLLFLGAQATAFSAAAARRPGNSALLISLPGKQRPWRIRAGPDTRCGAYGVSGRAGTGRARRHERLGGGRLGVLLREADKNVSNQASS